MHIKWIASQAFVLIGKIQMLVGIIWVMHKSRPISWCIVTRQTQWDCAHVSSSVQWWVLEKILVFYRNSPNDWLGGCWPGCPLDRACCVTPQNHHPPARARFTGEFRPKVLRAAGRWQPGPPGCRAVRSDWIEVITLDVIKRKSATVFVCPSHGVIENWV